MSIAINPEFLLGMPKRDEQDIRSTGVNCRDHRVILTPLPCLRIDSAAAMMTDDGRVRVASGDLRLRLFRATEEKYASLSRRMSEELFDQISTSQTININPSYYFGRPDEPSAITDGGIGSSEYGREIWSTDSGDDKLRIHGGQMTQISPRQGSLDPTLYFATTENMQSYCG